MRKTSFKTNCECVPEQSELYILEIKTHNQVLKLKVDKENLRHHIETIDNTII